VTLVPDSYEKLAEEQAESQFIPDGFEVTVPFPVFETFRL
jgi:hypothetical protein